MNDIPLHLYALAVSALSTITGALVYVYVKRLEHKKHMRALDIAGEGEREIEITDKKQKLRIFPKKALPAPSEEGDAAEKNSQPALVTLFTWGGHGAKMLPLSIRRKSENSE